MNITILSEAQNKQIIAYNNIYTQESDIEEEEIDFYGVSGCTRCTNLPNQNQNFE